MHYFPKRRRRLPLRLSDQHAAREMPPSGGKGGQHLSNSLSSSVCDSVPLHIAASSHQQRMGGEINEQTYILLALSSPLCKVNSRFFLSAESNTRAQHNSCQDGFRSKARGIGTVRSFS